MYGKIQITGEINLITGMHIGGSNAFAAIGAVDSPIIKDILTNQPMLPGSSLKGKMRSLLAKEFNKELVNTPDDDDSRLTRLFGSAKKGKVRGSRVLFSDMVLNNSEELRAKGLTSLTEIKFENSINRATAVANPRQIERAVRGSQFNLDIVYEVVNESEVIEDFETLCRGLVLLQYDYIGGNGSRGYGKVKFENLEAAAVVGDIPNEMIDKCNEILATVIGDN